MSQVLTNNAQIIQEDLMQKGLECKVFELPNSTRTAQDAAMSIGCEVSQICKSLIFKTQETSRPTLVLASGSNRVNEKKIETEIGERIIKADPAFTKEATGFAIGGIPPIGHKQIIEIIFIDQDLLRYESIWAAAGMPNAVFEIKTKDLVSIINGKTIIIT